MALLLFLLPTDNRDWRKKARGLLLYWGEDGEPVRVRKPLEVARTPAFWTTISFAVVLACWVGAASALLRRNSDGIRLNISRL